MKFVEDMDKAELETAVFGVGFVRDPKTGKPIERGRGAPGNPHEDSKAQHQFHLSREEARNAIIRRQMDSVNAMQAQGFQLQQILEALLQVTTTLAANQAALQAAQQLAHTEKQEPPEQF